MMCIVPFYVYHIVFISTATYPCWGSDGGSWPGFFGVCPTFASSAGGCTEATCRTVLPLPRWESPKVHRPQGSVGVHLSEGCPACKVPDVTRGSAHTQYNTNNTNRVWRKEYSMLRTVLIMCSYTERNNVK